MKDSQEQVKKTEEKAEKSRKETKKLPNKLFAYLKESRQELQKVVWPTRQETMRQTLIVILISLITAVFLGALDFGFAHLLNVVI